MHHITEDTPPDMLAGAMDLCVRLPDGRDVNMAVERSTPMMDLLVQVTTAYKLRPSDHIIQALDMSERERALPYKPNTPIGALDTQRIRVLPKGRPPAPRAPPPPGHQPFESTFRLQVHLPRNQFCVIRVGKFVMLEDIMRKVCEEKNLDPRKYEFRHPANIDKVLDPKRTLNDYEITEITVVHRGSSSHLSQTISSSDIMALQREEERRKLQAKTGGGVLNLIFRRGRTSMGSGSVSSDTRSISPTQSDDSRSVTPPAVQPPILPPVPQVQEVKQPPNRPKPPQRKRRPAPKPPSLAPPAEPAPPPAPATELQQCQQEVTAKLENGLTICHSRNSSDSSGYHEASILSDNCTTLPRRPKSTVINTSLTNSTLSIDQGMDFSKSSGNLSNMTMQSKSTMSLTNAGRKKKAPPPPPVLKSANSVANISTSVPVVASTNDVESTPKVQSDNSPPTMNNSMPKPKPRTIRPPVPVPVPRRVFINSSTENLSLPVTINLNQTSTNQHSVPNSLIVTTDDSNVIINSETKSVEGNKELEKKPKQSSYSSDSELSDKCVISNERKDSKIRRERGFQIGKSMLTMEDQDIQSAQELTDASSVKTINSSSSSQNIPDEHFHNLEIDNIDMFTSKQKRRAKKYSSSHKTHTFAEIHDFEQNKTYEDVLSRTVSHSENNEMHNDSMLSLRSVKSIPAFMESDVNMRKWGNVQNLDEDDCSLGSSHHWVVGDSDAESTCPATLSDLTSLPRTSSSSINTASLSASLASFNQESSIQPHSRSNIVTPDRGSEEYANSPAFTSTPTDSKSQHSSVEENITPEQKEIVYHEVSTKVEPERKQCVVKETERERKKSIIEIERKLTTVEPERKQSLIREVKVVEQERKQSLVKEVNMIEQRKEPVQEKNVPEPILKDEKVFEKLDVRRNLTDAQKLDPIKVPKNENDAQEDLEEWQYTLPSPPTAFRDSSPTNFTDVTNYDTVTFNGLTSDSVVSNPALFEKLENIRDTRSETETIVSEIESSTSSKQEEVLTSKYLNLENLEKRKSLVLERELASLKITQNENSSSKNEVDNSVKLQRESLRNEIEEAIQQKSKSTTLSRTNSQTREKILLSATDSTLPNFKITTYDQPKSKINIYEDETVRSNAENMSANPSKRNSIIDLNKTTETEDYSFLKKRNSLISASTENMFFAKRNSVDDFLFKKPQEFPKYKKQSSVTNLNNDANQKSGDIVSRSESFSMKNNFWSRSNPVKRSKSHISLDKYKDDSKMSVENSEEGLHKSNSLFNVSGLQSLEVMRMILPKLGNTPPSTPEDPKLEPPKLVPQKIEPPRTETAKVAPPKQESTFASRKSEPTFALPKSESSFVPAKPEPTEKETPKKFQYSGPPAINLGTWSERPKSQISLKEDQDYKISNISAMKSKFSSQTNLNTVQESKKPQENTQQNYPSVNIRVNSSEPKDQVDSGKINIKINSEPQKTISHQSSGNVIIKIGNNESNDADNSVKAENKLRGNNFYSRFLNQTTAVGYRKPLGNINGVDKPRPHSIAFDSNCPDLSRVPIVRAVELKKPFKDGNKSVTQIIHDIPEAKVMPIKNGSPENHNTSPVKSNTLRHSSVYLSSENLNKIDQNGQGKILSLFSKPITRGNSFASSRNNATPVVKGFRVPANKETEIDTKQYGTLPNKSNFKTVDTSVQNFVPFSQSTLKRTENSFVAKQQQPEKNIFENVVLRKTASNGLPSNRHSVGPMMEVNGSSAPPPPPKMPKVTAVTKKPSQRQLQVQDPRDQLLESIRSFGGKAGLRTAK